MSKFLKAISICALILGAAANAHATEGYYGRVDAGYSLDGQASGSQDDGEGGRFSAEADLDDDWMADAGFGYAFANGFRAEGEIAYRTNDVASPAQGSIDTWSAMANGFYDFNRGGRFQPYIGAGVGYARVEPSIGDDDSGFAWQGLAGVGVGLTPRLMLDIGYRYFRVDDLEFGPIEADYTHEAVTVGLRWQFHAPAAPTPAPTPAPVQQAVAEPTPTPPAPVVCPTANFVVYFAWDRSDLDSAAADTITAAVASARQCNLSAATIIGHTDSSGSSAYNVGLSERRASVVRDALTARGIDAALLTMQARGETELARATGDGVREPLNRRTAVTIIFR